MVESLLNRYSVDTKQFKKDKSILLTLAGGLNMMIAVDEDFVFMTVMVGKVPDREQLYYDLLSANLKSAGRSYYQYAIDPQSEELLMSLVVQNDNRETDEFINLVEDFVVESKNKMDLLHKMHLDISHKEELQDRQDRQKPDDRSPGLSEQFLKA